MGEMKRFLPALLLCMVFALAGCGDSGSTDTAFIPASGMMVSGTVTDESGAPLSDVSVGLLSGDRIVYSALSEEDGRYALRGVAAGSYTLAAFAEGYAPYTQAVMVSANVVQNITLSAVELVTLSGTVATDVDGDLLPVEEAEITLLIGGVAVYRAESDEEGAYALEDVMPGTYTLRVEAPFYTVYEEEITLDVSDVINIELVLLPVEVNGTVYLTPSGSATPAEGAVVTLMTAVSPSPIATATCDNSGVYSFPEVLRGAYSLYFEYVFPSGDVSEKMENVLVNPAPSVTVFPVPDVTMPVPTPTVEPS